MNKLTYDKNGFYLDGEPFVVISGAMHYFRIPCEYWYDRLLKLKECGFNCVETYTCWNLHEPRPGEYDFSGRLDIERFIKIAAELGLYVILRPGPYICAEWEFGGLPWWIQCDENIEIRCMNKECRTQKIYQIEHFIKKMGVANASYKTLDNFGIDSKNLSFDTFYPFLFDY